MALKIITAPTEEPVSLDELKAFCVIETPDDNELLSTFGIAAREFVESFTGQSFAQRTLELTARCWAADVIVLPMPPLQSIVSLKHRDASGGVVTLADEVDYIADLAGGTIEPVRCWPRIGDFPDAVQLQFVSGFEKRGVPQMAKLAISALVAHWYENRTPVDTADGATRRVPIHVKAMLAQLRGGRLEAAS